MNELNSYSINSNFKTAKIETEFASTSNGAEILQYPRLDSKIILQNMEEVLYTVKKQHREKHKRKKELKKLAMIDAAIGSGILSTDENPKIKSKKNAELKQKDRERRQSKKNPLQEKSAVEKERGFQINPVSSRTLMHHFSLTPRKEERVIIENDEVEVISEAENKSSKKMSTSKNIKVTNAFEVMMNARNKSIGTNSPGREAPIMVVDKELVVAKAKRKLKLQEWAEERGEAKRKQDEEARAAYIEEQLEQRAKRFKQMLVTGASSKRSITKTEARARNDKLKSEEDIQKKKLRKRKTRPLSVDSLSSMEQFTPTKLDAETSEFLSKLNSPTKKRDSLLGYFSKSESTKKLSAKRSSKEVPECNGSTKTDSSKSSDKSNVYRELEENASGIVTSCGRPRRSCVGKVSYNYSPSKPEKLGNATLVSKTITRTVNRQNSKIHQELEGVDIIILDESTNANDVVMANETPKKIAPLFVRSLPKPSPDPEMVKARKAFLHSGVPEKLRLEQERQKQYDLSFEETIEIFPKITHVRQLNENELELNKEMVKRTVNLKSEGSTTVSPSPTSKSKASSGKLQSMIGLLSDCISIDFQLKKNKCQEFVLYKVSLPSIANKRAIIKSWKTEFERFPTYKCYNQMREKYRYFSAIDSAQDTEQVSESFMVTRRTHRPLEAQRKAEPDIPDDEYKPPTAAPNGELLFSEKYKPLLFEQVLVNLNPVTQLKEFLSNWSNSANGITKNSQPLVDSIDFSDFSSSNQGPSTNAVVLLGPVSSGKTNAVFALANEMNFNVLEINAGMKRTGKRLIQELQEATQSHQIRKDSVGSGSSQKGLFKKSLNGLKSKLRSQNSNSSQIDSLNSDSNSFDLHHSATKCLILIEDADIVFEQTDAGFTDAIYSLAASSKRPVIVVASNPNCAHLQRLISQNTIHFYSPNVLSISKFLAVLSLIENCPIQLEDLISLYMYNRRDLRKTLLELQFFIHSGGDRLYDKTSEENKNGNLNYFASPRKRKFSMEEQESDTSDINAPTGKNNTSKNSTDQVYMHRSLFEYFTVGQNSKWRIPFPVDFHLLNVNLNEIFQASRKLKANTNMNISENTNNLISKRNFSSKSPERQLITALEKLSKSPLDNLCSFYENLSVAALMDEQSSVFNYQSKQNTSIIDRLKPNISETISHFLLEKAIEENLDAQLCPYNLFEASKNCASLCEEFGLIQLRSNRARFLDYEPSLRSICRSEKTRSTLERRSTRFYHYLRNYSIHLSNFSTAHFDQACKIFQTTDKENINQQTQN